MTWSLKDADPPFSPPQADPETHHLQGAPGPSHSLHEPPHHPLPHRCASRRDQPGAHAVLPSPWGFTLLEAGGGGGVISHRQSTPNRLISSLPWHKRTNATGTHSDVVPREGQKVDSRSQGLRGGKESVLLRTVPSGKRESPRRKAPLVAKQHECASWQ